MLTLPRQLQSYALALDKHLLSHVDSTLAEEGVTTNHGLCTSGIIARHAKSPEVHAVHHILPQCKAHALTKGCLAVRSRLNSSCLQCHTTPRNLNVREHLIGCDPKTPEK